MLALCPAAWKRVEWDHCVPKSCRGRLTVPAYPVCHRTIHGHLTNAELARNGS